MNTLSVASSFRERLSSRLEVGKESKEKSVVVVVSLPFSLFISQLVLPPSDRVKNLPLKALSIHRTFPLSHPRLISSSSQPRFIAICSRVQALQAPPGTTRLQSSVSSKAHFLSPLTSSLSTSPPPHLPSPFSPQPHSQCDGQQPRRRVLGLRYFH
jgi:hypothetical protein